MNTQKAGSKRRRSNPCSNPSSSQQKSTAGRKKKEFVWKHVRKLEKKDHVCCNYCGMTFFGGPQRIVSHLLKIPGHGVMGCKQSNLITAADLELLRSELKENETSTVIGCRMEQPQTEDYIPHDEAPPPTNNLASSVEEAEQLVVDNQTTSAIQQSSVHVLQEPQTDEVYYIDTSETIPDEGSREINIVDTSGMPFSLSDFMQNLEINETIPDYEQQIRKYMSEVRDSWSIYGCTALGYWDANGPQLNGVTVYSPKGVIYYASYEDIDPLFSKEVIQDIAHVPSNQYTGKSDVDTNYYEIGGCPKIKNNICSHSMILCILNKMHDETQSLSHLLEEAENIASQNSIPAVQSENPFFRLQQVVQNKNMILSNNTPDSGFQIWYFWQQWELVLDAIRPLVQILHLFETFVPTIGYLYQALDEAEKWIDTFQQSQFEVLRNSFREIKEWTITDMHIAAAFYNPAFMFYNPMFKRPLSKDSSEKLKCGFYYMNKHLVIESEKQAFKYQSELYFDNWLFLFTDGAQENLNILHPVKWWETFGGELPVLKKYAIQLLSQHSNCLGHNLLHKDKFNGLDKNEKNGKLMDDFNFAETSMQPIDVSKITAPIYTDSNV